LKFISREGRIDDDIGENVERAVEMTRDSQKNRVARVPARTRAERCADTGELICDVERRTSLRSFVEQTGRDARQTGALLRVSRPTRLNHQIHVDDGQFMVLDNQDLKTVGQPATLNLRKREFRIGAGLRQL